MLWSLSACLTPERSNALAPDWRAAMSRMSRWPLPLCRFATPAPSTSAGRFLRSRARAAADRHGDLGELRARRAILALVALRDQAVRADDRRSVRDVERVGRVLG